MRSTSVGRRYAQAAFEVARESGDPQAWQAQLDHLAEALSDENLRELLRSPNLTLDQKVDAIRSGFPDLKPEILNLVRLLLQRNRIDIMPGVAAAFSEYVDAFLGRTEAQVVSARTLSTEELMAIQDHLNQRTGRTVKLQTALDPSIIGGVVIRVGDELIDASVSTRLERLRQRLA